jgi:hypothetical protein
MSAFLVKNSTLSKLADALRRYDEDLYEEYKTDYDLAKDLYEMNVQALKERYEDPSDLIRPFEFTDEYWLDIEHNPKDKAQFLMSLACYLYQCFEGEVPKSALYKKLEDIDWRLSHEIAMKWAEEQGAEWD